MRRSLVVVVALVSAACGGSSSPTAPTPSFPTVSGSYAGTVTVVRPELGQSVTCPATMSVTQTNANVSVSPIILAGVCNRSQFPCWKRDD